MEIYKNNKTLFITLAAGLLILAIYLVFLRPWPLDKSPIGEEEIRPASQEISVPFTSQAPEGDWREPWQNACEEASIAMIQSFYKEEGLDMEDARQQILAVFALKRDTGPESKDESMTRIAQIINSGDLIWKARVVDKPTAEMMKEELAGGRPIIAPVYAPLLDNPNYVDGGLDYHVIVIKGYDDEAGEFIAHDPGTKEGEDYRYPYDKLMGAIHDYLASKDYTAGAKRVLFTELR